MQATTTITTPTKHTPRNYQLDGIKYATTPRVKRNPNDLLPTLCRSMNTDAPGAGKSEQALWAADSITPTNRSICVIVPAFLVDQWFKLIAEQFPDDTLVSLEGQQGKRDKYFAMHARWYIISVQSLRRKPIYEKLYNLYIREHVDFTIIDESHYVKNPTAKQSVNVRSLTNPNFCPHVMLLTATPITKEADDLYHQLRIIDPITFHAQHEFLNKYCYFTWTSWGATNVTLKKSAHAELEALREGNPKTGLLVYSSGYMLGRTYAQIGLELPDLIPLDKDAIVSVEMEPNRRKAYDDLKQAWYTQLQDGETLSVDSAMQLMNLLRRITNSPEKMRQLTNYMENDPGPYVIACFYRASAQQLADFITKILPDKNPICITGAIDTDERVKIAKQYNKPNDVIVATIPSLCEGVDLSHANTVYFYEEDYTPGRMYQFLSRVRRHRHNEGGLGVTITADNRLVIDDDPNSYPIIRRYFHATKSIDERIHAVQSLRSVNIRDLVKVEVMS